MERKQEDIKLSTTRISQYYGKILGNFLLLRYLKDFICNRLAELREIILDGDDFKEKSIKIVLG